MPHSLDTSRDRDAASELISRARTDRQAMGRLYDLFYPAIFRYCLHRLFVRTAAEDVTSEVFFYVVDSMHRFDGDSVSQFRGWLYAIATRRVNAYIRVNKRRRQLLEAAAQMRTFERSVSSPSVDMLDWPALYEAIMNLKPRDQSIITLRFFEGLSHEQIAGALNIKPVTVRVALSRTLQKLRARLDTDGSAAAPGRR